MSDDDITLDEVIESTGLAAKWENRAIETVAQNALAKGYPLDTILDITGLDMETIKRLARKSD